MSWQFPRPAVVDPTLIWDVTYTTTTLCVQLPFNAARRAKKGKASKCRPLSDRFVVESVAGEISGVVGPRITFLLTVLGEEMAVVGWLIPACFPRRPPGRHLFSFCPPDPWGGLFNYRRFQSFVIQSFMMTALCLSKTFWWLCPSCSCWFPNA